jgi:hypothetical protein
LRIVKMGFEQQYFAATADALPAAAAAMELKVFKERGRPALHALLAHAACNQAMVCCVQRPSDCSTRFSSPAKSHLTHVTMQAPQHCSEDTSSAVVTARAALKV